MSRREEAAERRANAYRGVIQDALRLEKAAFEKDTEVDGGDMVQFFAEWRQRAKSVLSENGDGTRYEQRGLSVTEEPA